MSSKSSFWFTPKGIGALGLIGAVSYFLLMEHRQHLVDFLPFLILLLCPLMHLFMHGGHGHGKHAHEKQGGHENAHLKENVDMDDYRRGYDDALNEKKDQPDTKDDNHAR
ncbi:DUF2933 domain-containing protein [Alkalimarinus coralli]|uniref:DUF2933 domain-containing protein n=1 Tax=Alkalimarinus coralli TaxID=2935863 RepID=UPI00202B3831|nr:DUF2933 domain-containing protein [Alkalimarinus coralli]